MNKFKLIQQVISTTGAHRQTVTAIIEASVLIMSESLVCGEDVNIVGFGAFRVKSRSQRVGRNPKTGESVNVPPRRSIRFAPSVSLAKRVKSI